MNLLWALLIGSGCTALTVSAADSLWRPVIDGNWWTVAANPDLGELTGARQQPVDFAVWRAADGTWQIWSCIRGTKERGKTRLFHGWESAELTNSAWKPKGIVMRAEPDVGETGGGLQAPYVFRTADGYQMFYGDWQNICLATSADGKVFERKLDRSRIAGMFGEGPRANARDPMVVRIGERWHCYYTAHAGGVGAVHCRTSTNLVHWSDSRLVRRGGSAGKEFYSHECPFVIPYEGWYYLFTTQRYLGMPQTSIYRSRDPLNFGLDSDALLVGTLPVAAPEIVAQENHYFIAALNPGLDGIRVARLQWITTASEPARSAQ